jgi:LemA protein
MELQQALKDIEADIANARLYYNGNVKIFNKSIVVFPTVILAGMLGFHAFKFFEADSSERENVKIDMRK